MPRAVVRHALSTRAGAPLLRAAVARGAKTYSAMVRVKNEQEFLERAILSIVEHVETVVIVDNLSTDATPQIIADLVEGFPTKVKATVYPHEIARYGQENVDLLRTSGGRTSPALLSNYYNWCLAQCAGSFVLKWDGDTIATDDLGEVLARFRASPAQSLWHTGANLHEDRRHLIAGSPYEDSEPRLFARRFALFDDNAGYCEQLRSPYLQTNSRYIETCSVPLYVHMKHCKIDRYSNISPDLRLKVMKDKGPGEEVSPGVRRAIARWAL